jgi:hypothetical protein
MTEQQISTTMIKDEKSRKALAVRMRDAIVRELVPQYPAAVGIIEFTGMDHHALLGVIADLAIALSPGSMLLDNHQYHSGALARIADPLHEVRDELQKLARRSRPFAPGG